MYSLKKLFPVIVSIFLVALAQASAPRPNIVYFFADDLGWGAIGANGQSRIKTPNLDALAAQGLNLKRGYGNMVCSPARSSQQTGFHQGHTWTDRNDPDSSKAIRSDDKTIGDMLSGAGYRTGYFGKWGYGADQDQNNPAINNPQTLPINHGYDVVLAEFHHVRAHTFFQPTLWRSNKDDAVPTSALVTNTIAANNPDYPNYPAYQNDAGYPSTAYCDDTYAFAALDFVRSEALDTTSPFFCLLAFQIPHTPLGEIDNLPRWFDAYDDVDTSTWAQASKQFAAMVTRMDAHMGNIMQALEDPNNDGDLSDSVLDNTLIIFASDNGGQGGTPLNFFSGNGSLRGDKGDIYEGGIRVPLLMKWSGKISANTTSTMVVDVSDMLPTLCDLAGVLPPTGIDGVSIAPTLLGEGHQRKRDFVIHESNPDSSIIRGDYKLISKASSRELYNLAIDESESNNIVSSNVALADELEALLIGERVKEGDDFANTYHSWTGGNNAVTSAASNWSDYDYSNGGTSYVSDNGAPRVSWTSVMENLGNADSIATADTSLELLSLEIRGNTHAQILDLNSQRLTGRNEIRVSAKGGITLNNGTLDTLRWVDLLEEGSINGSGSITGSLYHSGDLMITQSSGTVVPAVGSELISNGGFENGVVTTRGDYSYTTLENWSTNGSNPSLNGAVNSDAKSGDFRGLLFGDVDIRDLYQNTQDILSLGDEFTLQLWHRGFNNWATGEEISVTLYYLNGAVPVNIYSTDIALTAGVWNQSTFNIPALTNASAVGKELHINISPKNGTTGFCSLDDVSLVKNAGVATTIPGNRQLSVGRIYHASSSANLGLTIGGTTTEGVDYAQLSVSESASLAGSLTLSLDPGYTPVSGDVLTVVTADSVTGRFEHADDIVIVDGYQFKINYNAQDVTLEAIGVTSNGTPFSWLDLHGLGPDYEANDLADTDGDGKLNWQENLAGTDPNSAESVISINITLNESTQMNELTWPTVADRLYYIETSTGLDNYTPLAGPFEASENSFVIPNPSEERRFYRIRVEKK